MNALVTGGGGFLGRYIVEQLIWRGDRVRVFARGDYPELREMGVVLVRGDLQDVDAVQGACKGVDIVFHVAAKAGLWGKWDDFYGVNVIGTQNIIGACRKQGVGRLIFTSSPSVIFNNQPQSGCDESLPYPKRYENYYAHTKALSEQLITRANSPSLLTVSLRPHLIWGPRDTHILPGLIARARRGQLIQVGDGLNMVDLTYVEDAARAHLLAADALQAGSSLAGSFYFISQAEPVRLWPWVKDLLRQLNLPPIKGRIPLGVARMVGLVLESVYRIFGLEGEPRISRFLASELAMSHYYDISRAKRDFGYKPQYTMTKALEKTMPYLKSLALGEI